jgi:hypothetical protein
MMERENHIEIQNGVARNLYSLNNHEIKDMDERELIKELVKREIIGEIKEKIDNHEKIYDIKPLLLFKFFKYKIYFTRRRKIIHTDYV